MGDSGIQPMSLADCSRCWSLEEEVFPVVNRSLASWTFLWQNDVFVLKVDSLLLGDQVCAASTSCS
jgi:hypothetical protein